MSTLSETELAALRYMADVMFKMVHSDDREDWGRCASELRRLSQSLYESIVAKPDEGDD